MTATILTWLKRTARCLCLACIGGAITTAAAAGGTTTNAPAKPVVEIAKSTFAMPRNKTEGRDPFNPNSTYPYEQSGTKTGGKPVVVPPVDLQLKAIGGTPENPLVTINSRTFGKGEDGEMNTSAGRIQIHIVDILEDSVILTVNGEQRELRFRRQLR